MSNQDDLEALKTGVETPTNTKTQENFVQKPLAECELSHPPHQKKKQNNSESSIVAFTIFMPFNVLVLEYFVFIFLPKPKFFS